MKRTLLLLGLATLYPPRIVSAPGRCWRRCWWPGGVIVVVSTILAFLSGMDVRRRILMNLGMIAAAVAVSYLIGLIAKAVWGISV